MGLLLLLFHLAWMRTRSFCSRCSNGAPSRGTASPICCGSPRAAPFLGFGIACGAVLAATAFAVGAFAMPYLLHRRNANLFEAIATSVTAVRLNLRPMALWATLIVLLVVIGMVPGLLGLAIVVPVVGHATWHAYRDIVIFPDEGSA